MGNICHRHQNGFVCTRYNILTYLSSFTTPAFAKVSTSNSTCVQIWYRGNSSLLHISSDSRPNDPVVINVTSHQWEPALASLRLGYPDRVRHYIDICY